jgi:hypothetical protein
MSITPDFSAEEINIVKDTLAERYGAPKEVHLADVELHLSQDDRELSERPALYWQDKDCHFIIAKLGPFQYHNQFFYRGHEQFGTGRSDYDNLFDCTATLLRLQADHQAQREAEDEARDEAKDES